MSRTTVAGHPLTQAEFNGEDADHELRMTSAATTLVTKRSAVNFGVLCLIDATQRDYAARMRAGIERLEIDVGQRLAKLVCRDGNDATA